MNAMHEAREPSARYLAALEPPLLQQFDLIATAPKGVARLRELILTLAVQGKLVPQDPNDEPATVLLERIRGEKARLVKDGKIRKEKPLAEIAEEEKPFALPANWEWVRLAAVGSLENGDRGSNYPSKPDFVASGVRFINAGHLRNQRVDNSEMNYIEPEKFRMLRSGKIRRGDILYCLRGSLGKTALVDDDNPGAIASSLVIVRICDGLSSDYALLYLASPLAEKLIRRFDNGTAQPNLGANDLAKFVLPLPPVTEQSRIVARVEELMALCDALEGKGELKAEQHARLVGSLFDSLANSESAHALAENWQRIATHFDLLLDRPAAVDALEQTILQLAVRGLLVPQDPADEPASALLQNIRHEKDRLITAGKIKRDKPLPQISDEEKRFELPESWEWVPVETLAHVGTGTTPSRDNPAFFSAGSIPWVTSGETSQEFIQATAEHVSILALETTSLTLYPKGTLIVAMYGQGKTRGQVSELLIEATTNQACAAIVLIEPNRDHRAYVKLVFEKSYDEIREFSAGGAQPNLNVGKVKATPIPLPPLAEQSRIIARVSELRTLCAKLRRRLSAAQQTKSRLADALVTFVAT